jgi:hypothetical protein
MGFCFSWSCVSAWLLKIIFTLCSMFSHQEGMDFVFRLTIRNLNYVLWCIAPQVKRSSNDVPAEADLRAGGDAP